jgi:ergothioneine biosynthesis protein EgtB
MTTTLIRSIGRADAGLRHASLARGYRSTRAATRALAEPLSAEDCMMQSMPDASPTKWHLAHTSWFFETFVLARRPGYRPFDGAFAVLFNSYYESVGAQHPRPERGALSRPDLATVWRYRDTVDERVLALLERVALPDAALDVVELGLHHEQQHQELILSDIKHALSRNATAPRYRPREMLPREATALGWQPFEGGLVAVGARHGFSFDNERPRHRVWLDPFALATRLSTAAEYRAFIDDGGYRRPELWLSEGWDWRRREAIDAPLYWLRDDGDHLFTLGGLEPLDPHAPVVHLSLYEADAFARWSGARLPREHELELAAQGQPVAGNFVESGALHPRAADPMQSGLQQLFGDCWEWTQSSYAAYPGYRAPDGALGEYNGKFMCNQHVLRGGSCASPQSHLRDSYRNFFPAHARWQLSGVRLARDP